MHRSYVDWLIVARITKRRLRYIVKEEVWKSKLAGRMLEVLGAFPVNRSGADREALERCQSVLAGGEPLVMFPEGTRRSGPEVDRHPGRGRLSVPSHGRPDRAGRHRGLGAGDAARCLVSSPETGEPRDRSTGARRVPG